MAELDLDQNPATKAPAHTAAKAARQAPRPAHPVLRMQKTAGNRAVTKIMEERRNSGLPEMTAAEQDMVRRLAPKVEEVRFKQAMTDEKQRYTVTEKPLFAALKQADLTSAAFNDLQARFFKTFEQKALAVADAALKRSEDGARREQQRYSSDSEVAQIQAAAGRLADLKEVRQHIDSPLGQQANIVRGDFESAKRDLDARFPILLSHQMNYRQLADATPQIAKTLLRNLTAEVLTSASEIREKLTPQKIWQLPPLIKLTKKAMGISKGDGPDLVLEARIAEIASDQATYDLFMTAASLGLTVLAIFATGGLATEVVVATGVVSAVSGADHLENFSFQNAAYNSSLDTGNAIGDQNPNAAWLIADLASSGLDVAQAAAATLKLTRLASDALRLGTRQATNTFERAAREQYRRLIPEARGYMTENEFVAKLLDTIHSSGAPGGIMKGRMKIMAEIMSVSHPRALGLMNGDPKEIKKLIVEFGDWKSLIESLQKGGGDTHIIVKRLQEYREKITFWHQKYGAKPLHGASKQPGSDVDLNVSGAFAGRTLLTLEAEMAKDFGKDWKTALRMSFFAEVTGFSHYDHAMRAATLTERMALNKRFLNLSADVILAKSTHHAHGNAASLERIEQVRRLLESKLGKRAPMELAKDTTAARRDFLFKLDEDVLAYEKVTDRAERVEKAAAITEDVIRGSAYTEEAYASAGAMRQVKGINVQGFEAVGSKLAQFEMIEHIIGEHGGDIVKAMREYEIWKYMGRDVAAGSKVATQSKVSKYLEKAAELASKRDRATNRLTGHLGNVHNVETAYFENVFAKPATEEFLLSQFEMYWKDFNRTLAEGIDTALARPAAWKPD